MKWKTKNGRRENFHYYNNNNRYYYYWYAVHIMRLGAIAMGVYYARTPNIQWRNYKTECVHRIFIILWQFDGSYSVSSVLFLLTSTLILRSVRMLESVAHHFRNNKTATIPRKAHYVFILDTFFYIYIFIFIYIFPLQHQTNNHLIKRTLDFMFCVLNETA